MDEPPAIPPRDRPRVPKQQPIRVNTISTSSPSTTLSSSAPAYSFLQSPPPTTAPAGRQFSGNVGRSRSSSRSGGVVITTRPRAASEAARTAMEAMVQARLDQIKTRLNSINSRSNDLHARTQEFSKDFQSKVKRLYVVEDHLLRIQGKPGLSERYLEHGAGTRPRRLTNDLEDLEMGVQSLRTKFQAAGTVVTTANWLKDLRKTRQAGRHDDMTCDSSSVSSLEFNGPRKIITHSASSSISYVDSSEDDMSSQRSSPLTPRAPPLSGSVLHSKGFEDRLHAHSLRSRPLSSIPDQEEPLQMPSHRSPTTAAVPLGSANMSTLDRKTLTSYSSLDTGDATLDSDAGSLFEHDQHEPLLELLHAFPTPTSSASDPSMRLYHHVQPENADAAAVTFSSEPVHKEWRQPQEEQMQTLSIGTPSTTTTLTTFTTPDETCSRKETILASSIASTTSLSAPAKTDSTIKVQSTVTQTLEQTATTRREVSHRQDTTLKENQHQNEDENDAKADGWVQALWRLLVRAEYFLLGTAVLGAMMPDNLIALCAGFLSALMYSVLIVHHRLTAPPGKEAPQPPKGREMARKKIRTSTTGSMSRRVKSSRP